MHHLNVCVYQDWFVWRDSFHNDIQCSYMNSYADGWLFALRAISKLATDAAPEGLVGVWPYNILVDAVWTSFTFENNEWPDSSKTMWTCFALNIGTYVVLLLVLIMVALSWDVFESFYYANFAIIGSRHIHSKGPNVVVHKEELAPRKNKFQAEIE